MTLLFYCWENPPGVVHIARDNPMDAVIQLDPNDPEALTKAMQKWREENGIGPPKRLYLAPNDAKHEKLWALCQKFIADNKICISEDVMEVDRLDGANSYRLIMEICEIVGYAPMEPEK